MSICCRYIAYFEREGFNYDVHWRPQVMLCNPCVLNYDYIIRFERLAEDSNVFLKHIQKNDIRKDKIFFKNATSSVIGISKTSNAFSTLDSALIDNLVEIFEDDFVTMGYSKNF